MADIKNMIWDETPIDVTAEANFIWSIANKLRGSYMPDKYGDVIIPFTILRRFECTLEPTKMQVVEEFEKDTSIPEKSLKKTSGYQFYNTNRFTLKELCNDPDHIADNIKSYINGFSANVQDIMKELEMNTHIDKMNKDGCLYTSFVPMKILTVIMPLTVKCSSNFWRTPNPKQWQPFGRPIRPIPKIPS